MKPLLKQGLIIGSVVLFCCVGVWLEAFDFQGAYQTAKSAATSAMDTVKGAVTSVATKAQEVVTSAQEAITNKLSTSVNSLIKSEQIAIVSNPYKDTVATVRVGNQLHPNERAYVTRRKPKVKIALERMLGRTIDDQQVPTIALVGSGGGYRAMLAFLGVLMAADQMGLWNATTYVTALSGATWALAPLISTGMPIPQFKNYLTQTIVKNIHVSSLSEAKNILDMLMVKLAFDQPITTVDMYGGLLANRLLSFYGTNCQRVYLSAQAVRIENADVPYPIYTAIDAREAVAHEPHWFEFTPHEIGTPYFGVYVPTWAYGRQFNGGASVDFAPEQDLGFHMGTFGSAFGVHFGRAWDEVVEKIPGTIIKSIVEKKLIDPNSGKRITAAWGEIFNFMYGMPNQELKDRETIKLVDAGIDFNLPYPPISGERAERKADIIILVDASGGLPGELEKTENYARRKGLKFPPIDYTGIQHKAISIFKDPSDPLVPVVIYLPRVSDAQLWHANKSNPAFSNYSSIEGFDFDTCTNGGGVCGTSNFQYTPQESQQLIEQMEFNTLVNKDSILEAINWVIDRKK